MAKIEIKHDKYAGGIKSCHECTIHSWRCPMSLRIHTDPAGFYRPGPDCPGPGLYDLVPSGSKTFDPATQRVVDEGYINDMHSALDDVDELNWQTDQDGMPVSMVRELLNKHGLGRKD